MSPRWPCLVLCCLSGCAASGDGDGRDDPFGAAPPDFAVAATQWSAPAVAPAPGSSLGEQEKGPGRFLLFADGALHWAPEGGLHPQEGLPPRRRLLTRRQMAEIWSLVHQLGFADPVYSMPVGNVGLVEAAPGQTVSLVVIIAAGDRSAFVRRAEAGEPPDPALGRLISHLADLAWAAPEPVAPRAVRHYDFGPDPYARYRP